MKVLCENKKGHAIVAGKMLSCLIVAAEHWLTLHHFTPLCSSSYGHNYKKEIKYCSHKI